MPCPSKLLHTLTLLTNISISQTLDGTKYKRYNDIFGEAPSRKGRFSAVLNRAMTVPTVSPLESTVENHIDSTSRLVRQADLAISLFIILSLITAGLFMAVLADHWLLKEGLSMPLRLAIFAALLAAAGLYAYRKIVPLLLYPINPVYTADLIEKDTPVFKNSLINWLLLRQERMERTNPPENKINDRMFDGIVQTAAAKVQTLPAGHAVDLQKVIWAGTVLALLLVLFVAYAALSPKNPFASLARVMLPFSGIERPQAAQFRNINPGNATVLQGETLTISAEVVSQSIETVYLVFSTDDGQAVNQRIPMTLPEGKIAFETLFPPGKQGLDRGFNSSADYWIAQGESQSKQYRIEVLPAASVEVVSLAYKFPDYTGKLPETIEHGGDIKALEGTEVTVAVRSTLPLQEIDLVFDDNQANRVRMMITDAQKTEAKGTFTLKASAPHRSFAFRATDTNGNASRRSGIYHIEVIPDQPPKVQWADTAANLSGVAQIDLPLNKTLQLPIQAEDPDFALRYLVFKTESPGKRIPDVPLISSPSTGPTGHRGQIKKTAAFSPEDKRLAVGDTVEIFAEARDTKLPDANVSATRRIKINVVDPEAQKEDPQEDREKEGEGESEQNSHKKGGGDDRDEKNPKPDNPSEGQSDEGQGKQEQPKKQDPSEKQEPEGEGEKGERGEGGKGAEGQQDPDAPQKEQENESKGGGQRDTNDQKSDQEGTSEGGSEQQGGQPDDSKSEKGGNEPADGGKEGAEGQPDGRKQEGGDNAPESQSDNQPGRDQQEKGEGGGGEKTGGKQEQERNSSVNPETQDGDAMERIVDQMKEEGLFPGENPFLRNDNQRKRNDALDPNSPNQSNKGNDPTNPKESNQPSDGNQQKQSDKPNPDKQSSDKQNPEKPDEGNNPESGQPGDKDTQSGGNEGSPQDGQQDKGEQGTDQQQNAPGDSQSGDGGEKGSEVSGSSEQSPPSGETQSGKGEGTESSSGKQPQGDSQNGTEQRNDSGSSPLGGTGGGGGAEMKTAADDPNLEYANKVTNLVLDYLENQLKDKPNDDLLNKLGWTEDQLRQFYDRWQKMSQAGKLLPQREDGKDALMEAWKSIGLLPNQQRHSLQNSRTVVRDASRATETQRYEPPAALRNRARTYNEGIGK